MTDNREIVFTADDSTASAVVKIAKADVRADDKRDGIYATHVEAFSVTTDTVPMHVKALIALAYPGVTPSNKDGATARAQEAKNFQNKVRNGLNRALAEGKVPAEDGTVTVSIKGAGSFTFAPGTAEAERIVALIGKFADA